MRSVLGVKGAIFNPLPIARLFKTPEEVMDQIVKSWKDEDEQLEIILQHRLKANDVVEDLTALGKVLEGLNQGG